MEQLIILAVFFVPFAVMLWLVGGDKGNNEGGEP